VATFEVPAGGGAAAHAKVANEQEPAAGPPPASDGAELLVVPVADRAEAGMQSTEEAARLALLAIPAAEKAHCAQHAGWAGLSWVDRLAVARGRPSLWNRIFA
jgi:hypothetical protein